MFVFRHTSYTTAQRGIGPALAVLTVIASVSTVGCTGRADDVTLIFRSVDSRCRVDAYLGAHPYYGGEQIPGMPVEYGDPEVTYVYKGSCPSEGIYIQAEEIGDTVFTTDYYFNCREEPYIVEVYYASTFCSERVIE